MKTLFRILSVNIIGVLITISFFYFLTAGMGVNQLIISMMLIISPIWLLTNTIPTVSKSLKIFNYISIGICVIIGIWLTIDLRNRPLKDEPILNYSISEKVNVNSESVDGQLTNDTISDIVIITSKEYVSQYIERSDLSKSTKIDSNLRVYHQYKIDIFNEKFGCGIFIDDNGRKVHTQNYDR